MLKTFLSELSLDAECICSLQHVCCRWAWEGNSWISKSHVSCFYIIEILLSNFMMFDMMKEGIFTRVKMTILQNHIGHKHHKTIFKIASSWWEHHHMGLAWWPAQPSPEYQGAQLCAPLSSPFPDQWVWSQPQTAAATIILSTKTHKWVEPMST